MPTAFESFVNTELPLRPSAVVPAGGNFTPNLFMKTTGVGMQTVPAAIDVHDRGHTLFSSSDHTDVGTYLSATNPLLETSGPQFAKLGIGKPADAFRNATYTRNIILPPGGYANADLFSPVDGESGVLTIDGDYYYPYMVFVAIDANTLTGPVHARPPNYSIAITTKTYNYSRSGGTVTVTPVAGEPPGISVHAVGTMITVSLTDSYTAGYDDPGAPPYNIPPYTGSYPTAERVMSHTIDHANISAHAVSSADDALLSVAGAGRFNGIVNMQTHRITTLAAPTTAGDAIRQTASITEAALGSAISASHAAATAGTGIGVSGQQISLSFLGLEALTDPNADRIAFWDDSEGAFKWLVASTGLAINTTNLTLSFLGIQSLTDPDADRIMFWDDSEGVMKWLTANTGLAISGTSLNCSITQYTDGLARAAISTTVTGLTYTALTGVLSMTVGYVIPTTTQETNWNSAYSASHTRGHAILDSSDHTDSATGTCTRGDLIIGTGATPKWTRYAISVPAANLMNVLGCVNGNTEPIWQALFDATNPAALGTAGPGTSVVAAHRDHIHTLPKLDDMAAADDNTDLNATTTSHGLLLRATAPAAGLYNYVGITNGETAYTNKALFDATVPVNFGVAAAGTAAVAARRDHVHPGQDIQTTATPQFTRLGIGVAAHATTVLSVEKTPSAYDGTEIAAIFGDTDGINNVYIIGNTINSCFVGNDDSYSMWVNYVGHNGGTTRYRDFTIGNGKNTSLLFVDGSAQIVQAIYGLQCATFGVGTVPPISTYLGEFRGTDWRFGHNAQIQVAIELYNSTVGTGQYLTFRRSLHGTFGSHTQTITGTLFGCIYVCGSTGAAFRQACGIYFYQDGAPGAGSPYNIPGRIEFWTGTDAAAPSNKMTLYNSGKLYVSGEVEIDGAFNHDGSTFGCLTAAPASQRAHAIDATDLATCITRISYILVTLETFGFHATA